MKTIVLHKRININSHNHIDFLTNSHLTHPLAKILP